MESHNIIQKSVFHPSFAETRYANAGRFRAQSGVRLPGERQLPLGAK
jgi:hypothetical protein